MSGFVTCTLNTPPLLTVKLAVVAVIVAPGAAPLIVSALVPGAVFAGVVMVRREPVPGAGLGLKLGMAPEGRPLTARVTAPAKFVRLRLMV
jgi:hypothetical protein